MEKAFVERVGRPNAVSSVSFAHARQMGAAGGVVYRLTRADRTTEEGSEPQALAWIKAGAEDRAGLTSS